MAKLSKRVVDTIKPRADDYFVFDEELPGFGLRVLPSGRMTYLVQYRAGGRTRRVKIGRHGTVTPEEARRKARELLGEVAKGKNPAEDVNTGRRSPTVGTVCERFLKEHVASHCKASTAREYGRSVDLFIKPAIGSYRIMDVKRSDIAKLHHDMRHIPYQANRTLGVLSKMFNVAEVWGLRPDGSNPCRHVRRYKEEKRQRFLTGEELTRLGHALEEELREQPESKSAVTAIKLLILTGCRLGEIQTLKWAYVTDNSLALPDSKTGPKTVYLGQSALDVLAKIERLPGNDYVITGRVEGQYLTDLERPWRRIRSRAGLDDVRIHDLRHTFASEAIAIGEHLPMIGRHLGHSQMQTTLRYAHLAGNPVRQSADRISGALAAALEPANQTEPSPAPAGGGNIPTLPAPRTGVGYDSLRVQLPDSLGRSKSLKGNIPLRGPYKEAANSP